jgi:hypothetical protein
MTIHTKVGAWGGEEGERGANVRAVQKKNQSCIFFSTDSRLCKKKNFKRPLALYHINLNKIALFVVYDGDTMMAYKSMRSRSNLMKLLRNLTCVCNEKN